MKDLAISVSDLSVSDDDLSASSDNLSASADAQSVLEMTCQFLVVQFGMSLVPALIFLTQWQAAPLYLDILDLKIKIADESQPVRRPPLVLPPCHYHLYVLYITTYRTVSTYVLPLTRDFS